jgi:hypothetical protein
LSASIAAFRFSAETWNDSGYGIIGDRPCPPQGGGIVGDGLWLRQMNALIPLQLSEPDRPRLVESMRDKQRLERDGPGVVDGLAVGVRDERMRRLSYEFTGNSFL